MGVVVVAGMATREATRSGSHGVLLDASVTRTGPQAWGWSAVGRTSRYRLRSRRAFSSPVEAIRSLASVVGIDPSETGRVVELFEAGGPEDLVLVTHAVRTHDHRGARSTVRLEVSR